MSGTCFSMKLVKISARLFNCSGEASLYQQRFTWQTAQQTTYLVPVVTTKAVVCYQDAMYLHIYIYIYIYQHLSATSLLPFLPTKSTPKINHPPRVSVTSNHWWNRSSSSPTTQASEKRSRRFLIGLPYLESWWKNRDLCWGSHLGSGGRNFYGSFLAQNCRKLWWSSLSTHWLHVDLSGLVQNHLEMLFWSWRLNLVKSRQASSLQHCFISPWSCQTQNVFKNDPSTSCILVQHLYTLKKMNMEPQKCKFSKNFPFQLSNL